MPIRPFLAGQAFEPEIISVMSLAFQQSCDALGLKRSADDPATRMVAAKVIELAERGVRDPERLARMTIEAFDGINDRKV
jgi:hypothetical protein